jgi:hypothetical protein
MSTLPPITGGGSSLSGDIQDTRMEEEDREEDVLVDLTGANMTESSLALDASPGVVEA